MPDKINGKAITCIYSNAFKNCHSVTAIYIPDSVTKIYDQCFSKCEKLERVRLPQNIETISDYCFYGCKNLKQIDIPDNVTQICSSAFNWCENLEEIKLPVGLKSLKLDAFSGCKNLNGLEISQITSSIDGYGVDFEVTVNDKNPYYYSLNNCIIKKANNEIIAAGKLSNIPKVATSIGERAFCNSRSTFISIPGNIKVISPNAFSFTDAEEIVLQEGVEEIRRDAFNGSKIRKITIPSSVTKIEDGSIISGCSTLEEIVVTPENKIYYAVDGYILTKANNAIIAGTLKKPIPAFVKEIAQSAFCGNTHEYIFTPSTIKKINDFVFDRCRKVKTAVFCSESIGAYIFGRDEVIDENGMCFNLRTINISKDVKYIEKDAFYSCHNVNSITLPDDVVLGGNMIYSPIAYTVYYPQSADFSAMPNGRFGGVQSDIGYDGDFPYVKSIKPVYITTEYNGKETIQLEYSSDFLAPTREGYTFEGWSKNEDCSTLDYPVYIREVFSYQPIFDKNHYFLESRLTHNPFAEKQILKPNESLKPNEYYDPEVKILYAVWRKN